MAFLRGTVFKMVSRNATKKGRANTNSNRNGKIKMTETKWKGLPGLKEQLAPIKDLQQDETNARRHSERQIYAMMEALKEMGQHRPAVTDKAGKVIIGNGMLEAAHRLKWTHLACVQTDGNQDQDRLRALTDNTIADLGNWDEVLKARIVDKVKESGAELEKYGWTNQEIDGYLKQFTATAEKEAEELAARIREEPEFMAPDQKPEDIAEAMITKLTARIYEIARREPAKLTRAIALVVDLNGRKPIFLLADQNTSELAKELKRLADDPEQIPEGSPLAALSDALF